MASINDYLPREVLVKIFSYYMESEGPVKFLKNVSPVCKLWNDLCHSYPFWKEVSLMSLNWNSDHLLKLGERRFLTWTRTLNLSGLDLTEEEFEMIESALPKFKIEDLLQLIECCHNLKVLNVFQINFVTETTLQFIARKCPVYERFIKDRLTQGHELNYEYFRMVPIDDGNKMIPEGHLKNIQEKRRLDLKSRFANDRRIISKISDGCPFLEELHFHGVSVDGILVKYLFPVGEIQRGCPKLRVLEISKFKLDFSNFDDVGGFKKIRTLTIESCDFHEEDVCKIFRNASELENLQLFDCRKTILAPAFYKIREKVTVPVDEIQNGCPKLRVLKIFECNLKWSNDKEIEGFKEIRLFCVYHCNTRDVDVGKILKNSTKLEELRLLTCSHLELSHATEIPSKKVKCLIIDSYEELTDHLEKMVKKWRLTLKNLTLNLDDTWRSTRVLKALLQDYLNTVIEEITVVDYIDAPVIKSLIQSCQKLRYLDYYDTPHGMSSITLTTRQQLEEYAESL